MARVFGFAQRLHIYKLVHTMAPKDSDVKSKNVKTSKPVATENYSCDRCAEPCGKECIRGKVVRGKATFNMIGCFPCYGTYEQIYAEDMEWQDCCQACNEDPEFNKTFDQAVINHGDFQNTIGESVKKHGDVSIDTVYGQRVEKCNALVPMDQYQKDDT